MVFPIEKPPAFGSDEEDEEAYGYMEVLKWGVPLNHPFID